MKKSVRSYMASLGLKDPKKNTLHPVQWFKGPASHIRLTLACPS